MRRKKSGIPFKKVQKSVSTEFKVFIVFHRISSARFPCGREVCVQFFPAGFRMFPIGLSVFPPSFRKSPVRKCGNVRINPFRIDGGGMRLSRTPTSGCPRQTGACKRDWCNSSVCVRACVVRLRTDYYYVSFAARVSSWLHSAGRERPVPMPFRPSPLPEIL